MLRTVYDDDGDNGDDNDDEDDDDNHNSGGSHNGVKTVHPAQPGTSNEPKHLSK